MLNRGVMNKFAVGVSIVLLAGLALAVFAADAAAPKKEGFKDTPMLPGGKWHVHDSERPNPPIITPGTCSTQDKVGTAPSDAIVLFDGKDLSHWRSTVKGQAVAPKWKVEDGHMVAEKGAGSVFTKESFGDIQLHIEWSAPTPATGSGQGRGNSGVIIMGKYEVQVLDSYDNVTYADGQAGAVYGQYPPLVNACRPPGEWQSYDIIFEAPKWDADGNLLKKAYITVLHNGVVTHHRQPYLGATGHKSVANYNTVRETGPIKLQDHGNPTRFRNIWVRELQLEAHE